MPRDARETRDKLIKAAAGLFARRGVDGAQTRDIVRAAGQANDSAVHYHFRSRQGLLEAICAKHIARMEPARHDFRAHIDDDVDLDELVTAIIVPTAAELSSADGRDFLRIIAQIAGHAGVRTGAIPGLLSDTVLLRQLEVLRARCAALMPEPIALERIAIVIAMLTAALAERARQIEDGTPRLVDEDTFVANLVAMIVGALRAPMPSAEGAVT